jgi:peptide/nickel transport system substrate-binding protein
MQSRLIVVSAVALLATSVASCSSISSGTAQNAKTLYILMDSQFEHLDPVRVYPTQGLDFGRLIFRTLTTYKTTPGSPTSTIVGDLASTTGTASDDARIWTFPLRAGLKFQNGHTINCQDIKYAVERTFDPQLPDGPPYFRDDLGNVPAGYEGPRVSGNLPNSSIECVSQPHSIVFHLNKPVGDFPYLCAFPVTAPVPKNLDTGIKYDQDPVASGPYEIQTYKPGDEIVLVRNKYWSAATDPVRTAQPDRIVAEFNIQPSVLDQRMIANEGADKQAVMLTSYTPSIQTADVAEVTSNPSLAARADTGLTSLVNWIAINMAKVPSLDEREALNYLSNRQAIQTALGGPVAGKIATTVSSPLVPGHQNLDLFPAPVTGNVALAEQLLRKSGVKLPLHLTLAVPNSQSGMSLGTALQQAFARGDVDLTVQTLPASQYYTALGDRAQEPDMVAYQWGGAPTMAEVLPPLFCRCSLTAQGNTNVSQFDDSSVDARMSAIEQMGNPEQANAAWGALEKTILEQMPVIPYLYSGQIDLHGSDVQDARLQPLYGAVDLAIVGVG